MRYQSRVSGPLRDRIDLHVEMEPVSRAALESSSRGEPTAQVRERVLAARHRAAHRLTGTSWSTMAEVPGAVVRRRWPVERRALRALYAQVDEGGLSTRGLDRVVKVAWTLADLDGRPMPRDDDVVEAIALRKRYNVATARLSA
jgi:magnesium chelatase family protein